MTKNNPGKLQFEIIKTNRLQNKLSDILVANAFFEDRIKKTTE